MNAARRFFRKYFLSTVGILLLFLLANVVLAGIVLVTASERSTDPDLPVAKLAGMVTLRGGTIAASKEASDILADSGVWAMLLDDAGTVIWEERLPDDLPRSYTAMDIARFSRWYLRDYPVYVWEHPAGLFVLGYPPNSMLKYNTSLDSDYFYAYYGGIVATFVVNILLLLFLFWRSVHKVERAVKPILTGINTMAQGKPVALAERGELARINAELNRAGERIQQKDTARAEWIQGVSHDIRTPLSVILGYAGEMEDDPSLPPETRKQAGIIRKQGEKLRKLIGDLNLAARLQYSMQPMRKAPVSPVELVRQAMSDVINNGLDERYALELATGDGVEKALIMGDHALLMRMLGNVIGNSVGHNPDGCAITLSVEIRGSFCVITLRDTGRGVEGDLMARLNATETAAIEQGGDGEAAHGNGLKLVRRIVKAHDGAIGFSNTEPHGLTVRIELPVAH